MGKFSGFASLLNKLSSVKILQRNIKGNSPGSTAVKNNFSPLITLSAYLVGLTKIKIITTIIIVDKRKELKFIDFSLKKGRVFVLLFVEIIVLFICIILIYIRLVEKY